MNKLIISVILVAVIVGSGAFFVGMKYAESKSYRNKFQTNFQNLTKEQRQQNLKELGVNISGGSRMMGLSGQRNGVGFISGEILSKDDKSITIKLPDSGSKIIFFSSSTEITKSTSGTLNDLEVGKNITVNGTINSDGSITAQLIQLRSIFIPAQ